MLRSGIHLNELLDLTTENEMREFIYWYVRRPLQAVPYKIAAMMPRWLVYHCAIRLAVNASGSKYPNQSVPDLTVMDALKRWIK